PQHEAVRALMQAYFDSINSADYDGWRETVTRLRGQSKTRADWLNSYRTVKDGSILIYRIDAVSERELRAFVGFTSTQDPALAPQDLPDAACVRWNLELPLALEAGNWRVDAVTGLSTITSTC